MTPDFRLLSDIDHEIWDNYVDMHPEGTVFHKTSWLKMINSCVEIYAFVENDQIKAGVALVKTKKNGVIGYHIPPYTQYFSPLCGDLHKDKISLNEEHEYIKVLLEKIKDVNHVDFKLPKGHKSILPYYWKGFDSSVNITHIISGTTLAEYLKDLNKSKARELRKLLLLVDSGDIIVDSEIEEPELRDILNQTGERRGFDVKASFIVKLVMKTNTSLAKKIVIRSKKHGLIAFGFLPFDTRSVYSLINTSVRITDPMFKTISLLLHYKGIEFALTTGKSFDFEGSMVPGVENFYRVMGGEQTPVYRVQKSRSLLYSLLRAARQIKNDRKKT